MDRFYKIGVAIGIAILLAGVAGDKIYNWKTAYRCTAGPDEQCASDLFYKDWSRLHSLQKKYEMPHDVQIEVSGLIQTLQQQIPAGMQWDIAKERFVKMKPIQPIVQPTPAPSPEKK